MHKCTYCGKEYPENRGVTFVMNSGKINFLCSSKCYKNLLLKRRKVRWVTKMKFADGSAAMKIKNPTKKRSSKKKSSKKKK